MRRFVSVIQSWKARLLEGGFQELVFEDGRARGRGGGGGGTGRRVGLQRTHGGAQGERRGLRVLTERQQHGDPG